MGILLEEQELPIPVVDGVHVTRPLVLCAMS